MSNGQSTPPVFRRNVRKSVELACEVVCSHVDEPLAYMASELSSGGMWIPGPHAMRIGEHVVVCFKPDGDWLEGELMVFAEVVRVASSRRHVLTGDAGMAIEFIDLSHEQARALHRWLTHCRAPLSRRRAA